MLIAQKFQENYHGLSRGVDYETNQETKFKQKRKILRRIVEAIALCAEQEIPLKGHRENNNCPNKCRQWQQN